MPIRRTGAYRHKKPWQNELKVRHASVCLLFFVSSALAPMRSASSTDCLLCLCNYFLDVMLPEIFLFVICLGLPLLTKGRDLTETILLSKFKVNVKVNCRALDETGSSFRHWILPNLVVVGGNVSENSPTNIIVWPGNFSLGIRRCVTSLKFSGKVYSGLE